MPSSCSLVNSEARTDDESEATRKMKSGHGSGKGDLWGMFPLVPPGFSRQFKCLLCSLLSFRTSSLERAAVDRSRGTD